MLVRAATAIALLAGFLVALFALEPLWFAALIALIVAVAAFEWARLAGCSTACGSGYAAAAAGLWWLLPSEPAVTDAVLALACGFWVAVAPIWLRRGLLPRARPARLALGAAVLVPAATAMLALERGALLALLGLVWIADSAAYVAGRLFGRRKLAPELSPGKTWEGALGAVAACLLYAIILAASVPDLQARVHGALWIPYLAGAVFLCATSIVGDLFESAIKRSAGAKDSGSLLPGHGGVLDRIDSVTAALPVGALLVRQAGLP
ncbi:MAG: phosphatidate cytidylyltransferase [Burkholderiales bacterium]|nr:phosphatidate cytidylyltransferase [Burkholderiales bacterium]